MSIDVANIEMETWIQNLKESIKDKDKERILLCYEEINLMNFDMILPDLLNRYDDLVSDGNDILYA